MGVAVRVPHFRTAVTAVRDRSTSGIFLDVKLPASQMLLWGRTGLPPDQLVETRLLARARVLGADGGNPLRSHKLARSNDDQFAWTVAQAGCGYAGETHDGGRAWCAAEKEEEEEEEEEVVVLHEHDRSLRSPQAPYQSPQHGLQ